jgi:hypothetical protein
MPVTSKIAAELTAKVAGMSIDECATRVDEILTTPGSDDDPTLMLELVIGTLKILRIGA